MTELRYKEGIPIFDGSAEQYVAYRRAALNYVETLEWKKRPLAGPRLQAVLEGAAKAAVQHKPPGWISHDRGAQELLDYLKGQVQPPTLAEAGKTISRFFYQVKRRKGETMSAWIVRHDEALYEARRTLAEAIQEYGKGYSGSTRTATRSERGGHSHQDQQSERSHKAPQEPGPFDENGRLRDSNEDEETAEHDSQNWWTQSSWWGYRSGWRDYDRWEDHGWWPPITKENLNHAEVSVQASEEAERFLPDFVVAWMLLQRSGLDGSERATIVASLRNDFSTDRVKQALRLNWTDEDLRRRDQSRGSALMMDEEEVMLHDEELVEAPIWMTEEETEEYNLLSHEAEEALAAIQGAKRTLREAREKQSMMRKSRNFYPVRRESVTKWKSDRQSTSEKQCFRCGGKHPTGQCPKKEQGSPASGSQAVHFTFTATGGNEPEATHPGTKGLGINEAAMMMDNLLQNGKAIIDGGATSTVGSVDALDRIRSINWDKGKRQDIPIDNQERPSFRFGNNGKTTCVSTAQLNVPLHGADSTMRVHVHEVPNQPVLLSIASLRKLGAVIDFNEDKMILKAVDPCRVIKLERTSSGHQVFPLTEDVYSSSTCRQHAFKSLCENVE